MSTDKYLRKFWNWFGDHGCFLGGAPLTDDYCYNNLLNSEKTPFERLYISKDTYAFRLLHGKDRKNKIYDVMELALNRRDTGATKVVVYEYNGEWGPEPVCIIPESEFIEKYKQCVRVL